ncbi:MAG: hypothetical protein HFJ45_00225 [Clostridia bacterium]|nr:hypothetical protein [Clostridia bacterium]
MTGENGIISKAQNASTQTNKKSIEEEIELELANWQVDAIENNENLNKEKISKELSKIGDVIIDYTDETIDAEYKNYQIFIDENNKVIVGGLLKVAKPTSSFVKLTLEPDVNSIELQVIGTTTDGDIESIESIDGLTPKDDNSNFFKHI